MSDEEQLETELKRLLANPTLKFPLSSSRVLGCLIANGSALRLSDQPRVESMLYKVADNSQGTISVHTDMNGVFVNTAHTAHGVKFGNSPLKRKRSNSDEVVRTPKDVSSHGKSLVFAPSADTAIQEVFSLLQRGTTRAKLLAEQVCHFP